MMGNINALKFECDAENTITMILNHKNRKGIFFESSYRTIYNLCCLILPSPRNDCETCGYCRLLRILKKYEKDYMENFDAFCILVDICLYPLNQQNVNSIIIKNWFNSTLKKFYGFTIYNILNNHTKIPRDVCLIIASYVYEDKQPTFQQNFDFTDLLRKLHFLVGLSKLQEFNTSTTT